jgi:hypothetical protein
MRVAAVRSDHEIARIWRKPVALRQRADDVADGGFMHGVFDDFLTCLPSPNGKSNVLFTGIYTMFAA